MVQDMMRSNNLRYYISPTKEPTLKRFSVSVPRFPRQWLIKKNLKRNIGVSVLRQHSAQF